MGLGLIGESALGAGEVEIDWEALKNARVVGLPMGWGAGGRWRYAEGSRNKTNREGWARMRTRRRKGVGLGKAVLVSGRPRRVKSGVSANLGRAAAWQSTPLCQHAGIQVAPALVAVLYVLRGAFGREHNEPLSFPYICIHSEICRISVFSACYISVS